MISSKSVPGIGKGDIALEAGGLKLELIVLLRRIDCHCIKAGGVWANGFADPYLKLKRFPGSPQKSQWIPGMPTSLA